MSEINTMTELAFVPMSPADLDAVWAIEEVSHVHPWTKGNLSDSLAAGHWAYCIRPQVVAGGVADDLRPQLLWAYCILFPAVDELHLLNITVLPALRRMGIGRQMMQTIEEVVRQQNMSRIILEVRPSNTSALQLYESMGYDIIGTRKHYYPVDQTTGTREDALVMAKSIKLES
ncbi:[SSU ribosomal protein S18P]-alanine acetyltransferase [Polynucleobacter meluiroseus]|jgi:[ribosomal protein S18]-alanine N-acetyltransferase|uniref:[Ribosomal protein bS18]-alanine N-acetyltransferase n=1 Tax=Polynucleobacter meluiroseus TaxID=1938814 RepID=A0A240DZL5_9BURK|nr:ribosomal protein S18-alanine N-acetyltransferase [Polynucleobacter meluiroseus]SNX28618.1 [SSU ribosomal protein S18P]-alanine acetyltransferase [Polynucleobacter meluiroseus]